MRDECFSDRRGLRCAVNGVVLLGLAFSLAGAFSTRADEPDPAASARRVVVGKCLSPSAALLHRAAGGQWQPCQRDEPVYNGEPLVALSSAAVASHNGGVRLSLVPDLARRSSLPVLESAVILHESSAKDLDFTLERGRVEVTNQRNSQEPARVRVRFGHEHESWELMLATPGTKVALVLYGLWPRGTRFTADASSTEKPTADLSLWVLNREVELKTGRDVYALHGPPGPAFFHWDSVAGVDGGPQRQDQLPAWARPDSVAEPQGKELQAAVGRLRQRLQNQPVREALRAMLRSTDASDRRVAVYALAAVDDLPDLVAALSDPSHGDSRQVAIIALRHWIGRGPGQDMRLYHFLVQSKSCSPNQAAMVLQLLHSFGENDLGRPATYETLIDYLLHDQLAIRQLAKWHLDRLVPAGRAIAYDPAGSREARQRAYDQWKKLVPNGKLPPEGKPK